MKFIVMNSLHEVVRSDFHKLVHIFRWVSFRIILPSIIMGTILNQQENSPTLLLLGQVISLFATSSAIIIALTSFRYNKFTIILVIGLLFSRFCRILSPNFTLPEIIYIITYCLLFCISGAITIINHKKLIFKQLMIICIISIPWMIAQMIGLSESTQFLRTDLHGPHEITQVPTLFMDSDNVIITTLQARPAGFVYANNYLSLIIVFAMALHFGLMRKPYLTNTDFILCIIMVLAMAKIVFLTFGTMIIWRVTSGAKYIRRRVYRIVVLFSIFIGIYAYLFPGLFAYNLSVQNAAKNMGMRILDLNTALGGNYFLEMILNQFGDVSSYTSTIVSSHESGYAKLGMKLYWIIPLIILILPFFIKGYRFIKQKFPQSKDLIITCCILMVLIPLITPFTESAMYWFSVGIAASPILLIFGPKIDLINAK